MTTAPRAPEPRRATGRLRFTDEWVGALVLAGIALFAAAIFEAGVLRQWLHPGVRLIVLLPQSGTDGMSLGADVEVIGIHAGSVRRIRLNPDGNMFAVTEIDEQAKPFIRRDSHAVIRRRFSVAGATYIDISRGKGEPLNWDYAVVQATTAPDPIITITTTIDQIRADLIPTLDSARATMASLQSIATGLQQGRGSAGKLLVDDALINQAQQALASLDSVVAALKPIEGHADEVVGRTNAAIAQLQGAAVNVRKAAKNLPAIARNTEAATADLPALLTQTQVTADQLRKLILQLRSSWLLGGGAHPDRRLLPPSAVSP